MNHPTPETLPEALLQSVTQSGAPDLLIDLGEAILDDASKAALDNEALLKIPVIGMAVGFVKGVLSVRDRLYVRKLVSFLSETSKAPPEELQKYAQRLVEDPQENKRASEAVLEILDRITSAEKAKMVGKVFRAYLNNRLMTAAELQHLVEMIDKAYLRDLRAMQSGIVSSEDNLANVGIKNRVGAGDIMQSLNDHNSQNAYLVHKGMSPVALPSYIDTDYTTEGQQLLAILREY